MFLIPYFLLWGFSFSLSRADTLERLAKQIRSLAACKLSFKLTIAQRLADLSNGILTRGVRDSQLWLEPDLRHVFTRGQLPSLLERSCKHQLTHVGGVFFLGPLTQSSANVLRAGLGTRLQHVFVHPRVAGPILASQPGDFQSLETARSRFHFGPPVANIEGKVIGISEAAILNHDAVKGQVSLRLSIDRRPFLVTETALPMLLLSWLSEVLRSQAL